MTKRPEYPRRRTRIAVLGLGRVGSAFVRSLLANKVLSKSQLLGTHHDTGRAKQLSRSLGITVLTNNSVAVAKSTVVVICVRPDQVEGLLNEIVNAVSSKHVLVSVAAGVPLAWIQGKLPQCRSLAHMHVLSLLLGSRCGLALLAKTGSTPRSTVELIRGCFGCLGEITLVPEEILDVYAVFAGCAPAFLAYIGTAWERLARESGVPRYHAARIVTDMLRAMVEGLDKGEVALPRLADKIATPGGVTKAGIAVLESPEAEHLMKTVAEVSLRKIKGIRREFVARL